MTPRALGLVFSLLLCARGALAGTELTVETRKLSDSPGAKPRRSLLALEGRSLHFDAGDGRHALVFRGAAGVLEIIDHSRKSVVRIERASAAALAQRMEAARAELGPLLGEAPAPAKLALRATGKHDRVNGIGCRLLEALRSGERLAEICEGPAGAAGVSREALAPLRELAAFAAEVGALLPKPASAEGLDALLLVEQLEGVPLRVRAFPQHAPATESRLLRATPKRFDPARFQAPPGYSAGIGIRVRE